MSTSNRSQSGRGRVTTDSEEEIEKRKTSATRSMFQTESIDDHKATE